MRFRGSIPSPYLPLSTLVASSHEETATTWGTAWFATPFTVRDFHPLLLAGFYRRFGQSHLMRPAQRVFVRQVGCDPCLRHPCASRGPEAYWIPAYAGKTLKNAVPSCADRPAGFLCDPCPPSPLRKQGSRSRPAAQQRTRHSPAGLLDSCLRRKDVEKRRFLRTSEFSLGECADLG